MARITNARLILTGIVNISGIPRADRALRLADYRSSLYQWIASSPFSKIEYHDANEAGIVTDDHRAMAAKYGVQLKEVYYELKPIVQEFGLGRAEAMMVGAAALRGIGTFYKATGRIFVVNVAQLVKQTDPVIMSRLSGTEADTRFYKATTVWFNRNLKPKYDQINDASHATRLESVYGQVNTIPGWRPRPKYHGWTGIPGKSGLNQ